MKKDTHPEYYKEAKVICQCGNSFTVGSTVKELKVDICSACHPFYTGKQKLVDDAGRVDKFQKRTAKQEQASAQRKGRKAKKEKAAARKAAKEQEQ